MPLDEYLEDDEDDGLTLNDSSIDNTKIRYFGNPRSGNKSLYTLVRPRSNEEHIRDTRWGTDDKGYIDIMGAYISKDRAEEALQELKDASVDGKLPREEVEKVFDDCEQEAYDEESGIMLFCKIDEDGNFKEKPYFARVVKIDQDRHYKIVDHYEKKWAEEAKKKADEPPSTIVLKKEHQVPEEQIPKDIDLPIAEKLPKEDEPDPFGRETAPKKPRPKRRDS